MVDYNKRQDVTVEEFKECVETCLPNLHTLHDELQRGNSINKAACKQILDNLHTKYIPNNLELFLWKNIGNVEEIVETATCTCGKIGMFNKAKVTYSACCAEHAKDFRLKRSVQSTIKKYGVAYNLQNKDTHKKTLEKWDGKSPFSNAENQKKAKEPFVSLGKRMVRLVHHYHSRFFLYLVIVFRQPLYRHSLDRNIECASRQTIWRTT